MKTILAFLSLALLAGCTLSSAQQSAVTGAAATVASTTPGVTGTAATVVTDGQLFCSNQGAIVALANLAGQPVIAKDASSAYVTMACAVINAIPVAPPAAGTAVPTVAAAVPPGA
jgi:hypothetical protein